MNKILKFLQYNKIIIWLSNPLKLVLIWLTDFINWCYSPFDLKQSYGLPSQNLLQTGGLFAADLEARFVQPSGEFFYQLPRPTDAGDTALFQGLATGMKILRGDDVSKQIAFIKTLFPNNRLIRGYRNDGMINDTTSNDSASGMLFFLYCALFHGDPLTRIEAQKLLVAWVNQLKADNWALCDQAGNPTQYGQLDAGVLTDPLRITILLGLLALRMMVVRSPETMSDYTYIYNKYKLILAYPKVKLLWLDTKYDTHRAAISLHVLHAVTNDERFKNGLQRIWRITKKENNAWVYTLCYRGLSTNSENGIVNTMLSTFDFAKRQLGNLQSLNDSEPQVKWGSNIRCKYPLPLNKRGSQDFFWQRDMNSLDEWVGNTTADTYHSGLDFLLAYHLAQQQGLV
ncbi:MAG: hypothetical protein ACREBR_04820 [bacterium]